MMTVGGMRMVAPQQEALEEGVRGWRMAGTKVEALHLEEVQRVEGLVEGGEEEGGEDGVDEVVLEGNHQKMEVRKRGQVVVLVDDVVVSDEDGMGKTTKIMVVVLVDDVVVSDEDGTEMTTKMVVVVVLVDDVVVSDEDGTGKTTKMVVVVLADDVVVSAEDGMGKTTKMVVVVLVDVVVVLGENFQKKMEVRRRDQVVVVVLVDVDVAEEGFGEAAEGIAKVTMRMEKKLKVGTNGGVGFKFIE